MNCSVLQGDPPRNATAAWPKRMFQCIPLRLRRESIDRVEPINISITQLDGASVRRAKLGGRLRQGAKHHLQIEGRAADDLENVGGRRLLLQRFGEIVGALTQFVEQWGVLDGDDGLSGESLLKLDLLVRKRPNLFAIDATHADKRIL